MGYEENVEIRTGTFSINRGSGPVDVGNVKLFSHNPIKQAFEIPNPLTGGIKDTKEFYISRSMKLTLDKHTYDSLQELLGLTAVVSGASRTITKAESFVLNGSKLGGNATSLNHGQASERPISIECIELVFDALAYTDFIAGDIGLSVLGALSADTGNLIAYDNVTRTILVARDTHADIYQDAEIAGVVGAGGTGTGTISVGGRTPCGLWPDALQAGAEWTEGTDFDLDFHDGQVARIAGGGIGDGDTVYGWYSHAIVASATMNFPKGNTKISTQAEYIYTHALQNGKTQEVKIPLGYITNDIEIVHNIDSLTEYTIEIKSIEKTADIGAELGHDKRIT